MRHVITCLSKLCMIIVPDPANCDIFYLHCNAARYFLTIKY